MYITFIIKPNNINKLTQTMYITFIVVTVAVGVVTLSKDFAVLLISKQFTVKY